MGETRNFIQTSFLSSYIAINKAKASKRGKNYIFGVNLNSAHSPCCPLRCIYSTRRRFTAHCDGKKIKQHTTQNVWKCNKLIRTYKKNVLVLRISTVCFFQIRPKTSTFSLFFGHRIDQDTRKEIAFIKVCACFLFINFAFLFIFLHIDYFATKQAMLNHTQLLPATSRPN